jgi:carboxylesterase type B
LPAWPAYDTEARSTLHFDVTSRLEHDPAAEIRAAWDGKL